MKLISTLYLLPMLWLTGCQSEPTREPYTPPQQSPFKAWAEIKNNTQTVELTTLMTGNVQVPISGMLDMSNPKTDAFEQKSMRVDVYAHWIHHPIQGDYLIDSGLDDRFQHQPQGSLKGLLSSWIVEGSFQNTGQDIGSQIKALHITVKGVFLTHIHGDHSAGIPALPAGIPIVIGKGASLHNYPFIMHNDHFDKVNKLQELTFNYSQQWQELGPVLDIFGDGSVWAISTPGHTDGHVSYLIHDTNGWVLLTGDTSHTRWGFENNVIPGWADNDNQAKESLINLISFITKNPDVQVIFGHEL